MVIFAQYTARLQGAYTDAREKDSTIRRDLASPAVGTLLQLLNKNKTELDAMMPCGEPVDLLTGEDHCHKEMATLEELLVAISGLLDDREQLARKWKLSREVTSGQSSSLLGRRVQEDRQVSTVLRMSY